MASDTPDRSSPITGEPIGAQTGALVAESAFAIRGQSMLALTGFTVQFHRKLLEEAEAALSAGTHETAVVLAQTASELCTEWVLIGLLRARSADDIASALLKMLKGRAFEISNDKLRGLYDVLAGDALADEPFWTKLREHNERRNGIVHNGRKCDANAARDSIGAVRAFIERAEAKLSARLRRQ